MKVALEINSVLAMAMLVRQRSLARVVAGEVSISVIRVPSSTLRTFSSLCCCCSHLHYHGHCHYFLRAVVVIITIVILLALALSLILS